MTKEKIFDYIKANNEVLGVNLHWVESYNVLNTNGNQHRKDALQNMYDFLEVVINGTFDEKLKAIEKYEALRTEKKWCVKHNVFYTTLLKSELKKGNYGTEQYPETFKDSIEYLKGCNYSFEAPSKKHEVSPHKRVAAKKKESRYNKMFNK